MIENFYRLKFFAKDTESGIKYKGPRDLQSLKKYVMEQLGLDNGVIV